MSHWTARGTKEMVTEKSSFLRWIQTYLDTRYPGWNLDAALRYLPVAEHLDRSRPRRVLDVGAGDVGLSRYWRGPVIEMDLAMLRSRTEATAWKVRGTALGLPFRDRSVDAVVCVDLLEHIPPENRDRVLSEMIRVARRELIVAVPCGHRAHHAEIKLEEIHEKRTGSRHPWLGEHLTHGLPDAHALARTIHRAAMEQGRGIESVQKKNVNLRFWYTCFRLYLTGGPKTKRLIIYYLLLLLPVLKHAHCGEVYRRIFFCRLETESGGG
jgi:SAM-dependent methyltransferase